MKNVSVFLLGIAFLGCYGPPSESRISELEKEGDEIVALIKRYSQSEGSVSGYELAESYREKGWRFDVFDDGDYEVTYGDYRTNGWELSWPSKQEQWYVDH